jgi:hypothetical protein
MLRLSLIFSTLFLVVGAAKALPARGFAEPVQTAPVSALIITQETEEREPGPADLEEAIEIAIKRYGGTPAGANTVVREGRQVHEVRVLGEDGSVRTVRIDPETGAIIPQRR